MGCGDIGDGVQGGRDPGVRPVEALRQPRPGRFLPFSVYNQNILEIENKIV